MREREPRGFDSTPLRRSAVTADRLAKPILIVEVGEIGAKVSATAFGPELRAASDQFRHLQHILDFDGSLDLKRSSGMHAKQSFARTPQVLQTLFEPLFCT